MAQEGGKVGDNLQILTGQINENERVEREKNLVLGIGGRNKGKKGWKRCQSLTFLNANQRKVGRSYV